MQLQSASEERTGIHQKSQIEVLKAKEHFLEVHGDKKLLAMAVEKLKAEMSQLSTASNTSGDVAKVLGELLGKFRGEQIRLEDDIKCINDKLIYAEGAYTAAAMNAEQLAAENAHMKAELAKSHGNLTQATISPFIQRARASGPNPTVEFLVAERARLEGELAKANGTLGTIHSSLSSYSMASPTSPNASDTAVKVASQTSRVLPRAKEPARNCDFINANRPVSEIKATNTTSNTSKPNMNTLSQAPSGDAMNFIGTTNSWDPDAATIAPSTAVNTGDWSFAIPGRTLSPSGSVESEL